MKMEMTFGQFSEANRARCESQQGFNHPNAIPDLVKALEEIDQTPIPMINDTEHLRHTIRTIQNIAYAALSKYRGAGK